MRPELLENSTFLRYYEKWQRDPTSVVFAAISDMFRNHGMIDDAVKIAVEGLKHHPTLISGRLALARAYLKKGSIGLAKEQAETILSMMPQNQEAIDIIKGEASATITPQFDDFEDEEITISEEIPLSAVEDTEDEVTEQVKDPSHLDLEVWQTVTMAKILGSQGHFSRARKIYKAILEKEPDNEEAIAELTKMKNNKQDHSNI